MSVVSASGGGSSIDMLHYLALDEEEGKWRIADWFSNLPVERVTDVELWWHTTREMWGKQGGRQYSHVSYSIDPNDPRAAEITDAELLEIGREFAAGFIPSGHDWIAVVHRDRPHPHIHLVWCTVNVETGRKYQQSRADFYRAIALKDQIDERHGLRHVPYVSPDVRLPRKVAQIALRGGYSWYLDLQAQLDHLISQSRSVSEYLAAASANGISIRVTGTGSKMKFGYHFWDANGRQKEIREKGLGRKYGGKEIAARFAAQMVGASKGAQTDIDAMENQARAEGKSGHGNDRVESQEMHRARGRRADARGDGEEERERGELAATAA